MKFYAPVLLVVCYILVFVTPAKLGGQVGISPREKVRVEKVKITKDYIPAGKFGRHRVRALQPKYITIHSTWNKARGAGARMHSTALKNGRLLGKKNSLGYLTWHFSVDSKAAYQHLPLNEQGQHADYEGQGNRESIGIEMCENSDGSLAMTMDRTARLAAQLAVEYNIPVENIVPHNHWRMIRYSDGRDLGHKACPHFLMTKGKPNAKWRAFQNKIARYKLMMQ